MHTTLSVFENLLFSARFRLPAAYTRKQRLLAVERAIAVLQARRLCWTQGVVGAGQGERRQHAPPAATSCRRDGCLCFPTAMQLEDVRDSLIGDEETRGIRWVRRY